jgi:hypothetical protein
MKIEIRRNLDMSFDLPIKENEEAIKKLMEQIPQPTEEQRKMLDEGDRIRREIEEKIWAYIEEHPENDLSGNPIKRGTHEIGFEIENREVDGAMYGFATNIYIRPKKSEYDKN